MFKSLLNSIKNEVFKMFSAITPMVQHAKNLSMNPGDSNAATNWRKANQAVSIAYHMVW